MEQNSQGFTVVSPVKLKIKIAESIFKIPVFLRLNVAESCVGAWGDGATSDSSHCR